MKQWQLVKRRTAAFILSVIMMIGLLPSSAFAQDAEKQGRADSIVVNTELPTVISSVDDLPSVINVTQGDTTADTAVVWEADDTEAFTVQTVTGTLPEMDGSTVTAQVAVAPPDMVYFVDAGADSAEGRTFYNLAAGNGRLKNTEVPDQAYSAENGWGYIESNTSRRSLTTGDIYEFLRYVDNKKEGETRTLTYQFDGLEAGKYTVYLGLYDPASWYSSIRIAYVNIRQGETILKTSEEDFGGRGTGRYAVYEDLEVSGDGGFQISLAPKNTGNGSDVQVSWIAIAKKTVKPVITLNGDRTVYVEEGAPYTDAGATALDASGNPLEVETVITKNGEPAENVDTSEQGVYQIHYNAWDAQGVQAEEVVRIVVVTEKGSVVGGQYEEQASDRSRVNMNRSWKFSYGDTADAQQKTFDDSSWSDIALPHNFSIPYDLHTGADGSFYVGYGWYRKDFEIEKEEGKRYNIEFEGVFQVADVYVNGIEIGTHEGGYSSFSYDITDALADGENTLAVRVNNIWQPDLTPRGGDYQFTGGIYRDVWLTVTDEVHVDWYGTFVWTPALNNPAYQESENRTESEWNRISDPAVREFAKKGTGTTNIDPEDITDMDEVEQNIAAGQSDVRVEAEVSNDGSEDVVVTLRHQVVDKATNTVVADFYSEPVELKAGTQGQKIISTSEMIPGIKLWDFENPNLYQVFTTVADAEKTRDVFESEFGFRSVQFTPEGFFLNGEKIMLNGVNAHQDHGGWADAVTNQALYRDVKMIDEAGFNFIRGSHYPHDPSYTQYTDEMGIGVWYEGGLWSIGGQNSGNSVSGSYLDWYRSAYPKGEEYEEAFEQSCFDLVENMIRVNRNHPSVLCWSMGNEVFFSDSSTFQKTRELVSDLRDMSHEMDPTRKAGVGGTQRSDFNLLAVSDIAGQNGDGVNMTYINPYVPTVISEYDSCTDWDRPGQYRTLNVEQSAAGGWPTKNITLADGTAYTFEPGGRAMWCMFDHGSIGSQSLRQTGIVDYYRLPKNAYYAFKNLNTTGSTGVDYPHSVSGTAAQIKLEANTTGSPDNADNEAVLTNDGTTDAQLIITMLDSAGNWVNDTPETVLLEVLEGPGVFPTGKTYTFVKGGDADGAGKTLMDGRAAIEFRSYYAGTTVIQASVPGTDIEPVTITVVTEDTVGAGNEQEPENFYIQPELPNSELAEPELYGTAYRAGQFKSSGDAPGYAAQQGNDANNETKWVADTDGSGSWWVLNAEKTFTWYKAKLDLGEKEYPYKIEVLKAGTTDEWEVAVEYTKATIASRPAEEDLQGLTGNMIRITFTDVPEGENAQIVEFTPYGTTQGHTTENTYLTELGAASTTGSVTTSGNTITMKNKESSAVYELNGVYSRLRAVLGAGSSAVTFRVYAVDEADEKLIYETNVKKNTTSEMDISVALAQKIRIEAVSESSSSTASWKEAQLIGVLRDITAEGAEDGISAQIAASSLSLRPGETFTVYLRVTKGNNPLTYDAVLTLYDKNGEEIESDSESVVQSAESKYTVMSCKIPEDSPGCYAEVSVLNRSGESFAQLAYFYGSAVEDTSESADKTELQYLYEQNKDREKTGYTVESYKVFEEALDAARQVLEDENADQETIDRAKKSLQAAVDGLRVSKSTLEYFLGQAKLHEANGETEDVVESVKNLFKEAIAQGEAVMADETATKEEVTNATLKLMSAIQALNMKAGDKTDLSMALELADMIELEKYVEAGQTEYLAAKEAAEAVMADGDAMQEEIDEAWTALTDAMSALRLKADKTVLQELVSQMSGIDLTGYTEESVSVFSAALASADSILTDTALASEDQQKVDDAVQALTAAKDALVLKEETASDEDVESGNRNDSSTGSSEGSTEDPESQPGSQNYDVTAHAGNDGQKEAGDDAPKTGDSASLIFWAAAMALGAGLAGGVLRRKNVK